MILPHLIHKLTTAVRIARDTRA